MSLQDKQLPIDKIIVEALVIATPENWNAAEMKVERYEEGKNERLSISISSPEGHRDLVSATDEIYEGLYQLSDCFRSEGVKVWKKLKYKVNLHSDGNWKYEIDFEY